MAIDALNIDKLNTKKVQLFSPYAKLVQTGPSTTPAALALVYREKTCAYAPDFPKIPGRSRSMLATVRPKSADRGDDPRIRKDPGSVLYTAQHKVR